MNSSPTSQSRARWRRHPLAGYAVLVLALAALGLGYATVSSSGEQARAAAAGQPENTLAEGEELFNESCATCHGTSGQGTERGPSLIGVGAASVHFQVSTGRMPARNPYAPQAEQKPVEFTEDEIRALAAYVDTFGPGGPKIPSGKQVAYMNTDPAHGGELFRANCSSCHNFSGQGGALTYGKFAPEVTDATPRQIYEAMQTGPGAMPAFKDDAVSPEEKRAIIHFIKFTNAETNPGGAGLGRFGPVSEGLVAWLVGAGLIVLCAIWITARKHG